MGTGANLFARSMGSAVGVAALGAVINSVMRGQDAVGAPELFGVAATTAFWVVAAVALATAAMGLGMPRGAGAPAA